MAQKAAKVLAARNSSLLRRTHLTTLALHTVFLLLHFLLGRPRSLTPYLVFTIPTLVIEFYFERLGRPRYTGPDSSTLRSPGEDLDASGLTEYFWDVLYWTWGCMGAACVFGDKAWWGWVVVPLYSLYLGYTTIMGVRSGSFMGLGGKGGEGMASDTGDAGATSKRQKKMEKRGDRVKYR